MYLLGVGTLISAHQMANTRACHLVLRLVLLLGFIVSIRRGTKGHAHQFELDSNDPERLAVGKERFNILQRDAEHSPCWRSALEKLNSTCKEMTDVSQSRLALAFTNCHLEKAGRETYPCGEGTSVEDCTNVSTMGDFAFQIYTQFYTHASHLCYFVQSRLWQSRTERTIGRLAETSTETVKKLELSLEYHEMLDMKQDQALKNQENILEQDEQIAKSLQNTKMEMDKAFQEMSDKAEKQKFVLDKMLTKLIQGMQNIQWILSLMLGEFVSLETFAFFVVSFCVSTFLPQFGYTRIFLYSILIGYAALEGIVKRSVLWWMSDSQPDAGMVSGD